MMSTAQTQLRTFDTASELLPFVTQTLATTDFALPNFKRYEGKVRDSYAGHDLRVLIATDRLSCFDKVVTTVPFKGQVLTQLALHWFKKTQHIVKNHIIDVLSPETLLVKEAQVVPVEVVVRGYLTGSAWRDYTAGKAVSGVQLPAGLAEFAKFDTPILTPSTKAEKGAHDEPISEQEIITRGLVREKLWADIREKALALFALAQKEVASRGLILVDTKFEFGFLNGEVLLVDEIFTLDSSRYWIADSLPSGKPTMLDKEPVRQWLLQQGFKGDGEVPTFTDQYRAELALHYIHSYGKIAGEVFKAETSDADHRILLALQKKFG